MTLETDFPLDSRVWIYQSNRPFSKNESSSISSSLEKFTTEWSSHGTQLNASFKIMHDQFIIILVDEQTKDASGCSIDSSVKIIREIEARFQVSLLDRSLIATQNESGEIVLYPFTEIKQAITDNVITNETTVFNNTVTTLNELNTNWQQSAQSSWLSRFFS